MPTIPILDLSSICSNSWKHLNAFDWPNQKAVTNSSWSLDRGEGHYYPLQEIPILPTLVEVSVSISFLFEFLLELHQVKMSAQDILPGLF